MKNAKNRFSFNRFLSCEKGSVKFRLVHHFKNGQFVSIQTFFVLGGYFVACCSCTGAGGINALFRLARIRLPSGFMA
jgi:hypothetical protein